MAAEAKRELFSEEAVERALAPERLDGYLRVVRPSAWVAVLAVVSMNRILMNVVALSAVVGID
jgi:hypothetical protein